MDSCAGCGAPFDPTGPCTADGDAPGAYPELEATVPKVFRASPPGQLDSGRTCTPSGLGTLTTHSVKELRFAGATWGTGSDSGVSLAVFTSPDGSALPAAWMSEFYESGARTGKNVQTVDVADIATIPDSKARRLDVLNGESYQTVIVWERDGLVAAVLVASFIREVQTKEAHEAVVREAVAAWSPLNAPPPPDAPVPRPVPNVQPNPAGPAVPLTPAPGS